MSKRHDISKSEALEATVALGVALGGPTPVAATAWLLAKQGLTWWSRNADARAELWWREFLKACRDDEINLDEMRTRIEERMERDPSTADVIMGHMRDVMDTVTSEAVGILGALRGTYYRDGLTPDGFFRGATELLMQCTDSDLFALRDLTARLSCVRPTTKSRTLAVSSSLDSNTGIRYQRVDHIELDVSPTERRGIPRVGWAVDPLWKRMQHLLVSTGLARDDNELYSFIVEHGDVRRLHGLVKQRGIREGKYLCYRSGFDNEHSAELVLMPCCFGYGSTPEEALASLKENLVLFVEDAATAELVKTPRPS